MESQVHIKNRKPWNEDIPIPVVTSAIRYWRLERSIWPRLHEAARKMGPETIASCVQ